MQIDEIRKFVREQLKKEPGIMSFAYPYVSLWNELDKKEVKDALSSSQESSEDCLYVHIPFCLSKCGYCDYASNYVGGLDDEERHNKFKPYVDAVEAEIKLLKPLVKDREFEAVYFGGGTPTIFCEKGLERIINLITSNFRISPTAEMSIEVYPWKPMLRDKLKLLKRAGINRVSIGIQDFDDNVIGFTGRKYTGKEATQVIRDAKELFTEVNIDLICGLPHQDETIWNKTLETTLNLGPQQVTVQPFSNRHPGIRFHRPECQSLLPGLDQMVRMYESACQKLKEAGYRQTSRHQFTLTKEQKYEQAISNSAIRLGLGAHSISLLSGLTYKNFTSLDEYKNTVAQGRLPIEKGFVLNAEEQMRSWLFYALSADCGKLSLNEKAFAQRFNTKIQDAFPNEVKALEQEGFVNVHSDRIDLTPLGIYHTSTLQRTFYNQGFIMQKEKIYAK